MTHDREKAMARPGAENSAPTDNDSTETAIVLHHIDKLYSTQTHIWESLNRIVLTQVVLSLILIALSSKVLSLDEGFEVSGLKFKISLTVILSSGASIIAGLCVAFYSQWDQSNRYSREIKRLYKSLGYKGPALAKSDVDAFEIPNFYVSIVVTAMEAGTSGLFVAFYSFLTVLTTIGILVALPVGAQIAAGLRVSSLFGWRWWVISLFCLLILLTISYIVFSYVIDPDSKDDDVS